jgi:hypothetical protein
MRAWSWIVFRIFLMVCFIAAVATVADASAPDENRVGVWGASPAFPQQADIGNATIRQTVRLSHGGGRLRLSLGNELGSHPLVVGKVGIALPASQPGGIVPASSRGVTFGGHESVTIQPGAAVFSDPIDVATHPLQKLTFDIFMPVATETIATHANGVDMALISDQGDQVGEPVLRDATRVRKRVFVSRIDVDAPHAGTIVALGDSLSWTLAVLRDESNVNPLGIPGCA